MLVFFLLVYPGHAVSTFISWFRTYISITLFMNTIQVPCNSLCCQSLILYHLQFSRFRKIAKSNY